MFLQYSNHSVSHMSCSNSSELLNYFKAFSVFWESYVLTLLQKRGGGGEPVKSSTFLLQYLFPKGFLDTGFSSWLSALFLTSLKRRTSVSIVVSKAWSHTSRLQAFTFDYQWFTRWSACWACSPAWGFQNFHHAGLEGQTWNWHPVSSCNSSLTQSPRFSEPNDVTGDERGKSRWRRDSGVV